MLAMVVNDNAGYLDACGVWATIASLLAPTGGQYGHQSMYSNNFTIFCTPETP